MEGNLTGWIVMDHDGMTFDPLILVSTRIPYTVRKSTGSRQH